MWIHALIVTVKLHSHNQVLQITHASTTVKCEYMCSSSLWNYILTPRLCRSPAHQRLLNVNSCVHRHCETTFSPPSFADHPCINDCWMWIHALIVTVKLHSHNQVLQITHASTTVECEYMVLIVTVKLQSHHQVLQITRASTTVKCEYMCSSSLWNYILTPRSCRSPAHRRLLNVNTCVHRHCETTFSPPSFADHPRINNCWMWIYGVNRHCETTFLPPGLADHPRIKEFGCVIDSCTPLCLHLGHILVIIVQHTKTWTQGLHQVRPRIGKRLRREFSEQSTQDSNIYCLIH